MECTTGAKILDNERVMLAFKNKDFQVESFSDGLFLENSHAFGVRGVNLNTQKMTGFSIGVNQYGLVAVNSNVLTTSDQPYDLITERIVLEARTVDDAIEICKQEIQGPAKYQWCNMIVATPKQLAAIELTSSDLATVQSIDYLVRTNHHLLLNTSDVVVDSDLKTGRDALKNSEIRYKNAQRMLEAASDGLGVLPLLKSHHQEAAICRHGRPTTQDLSLTTVYSYLVIVQMENHPQICFDVVKGPPCMHSFTRLELEFPLNDIMLKQIVAKYPV